jgi:hypothetical protein
MKKAPASSTKPPTINGTFVSILSLYSQLVDEQALLGRGTGDVGERYSRFQSTLILLQIDWRASRILEKRYA